MRSCSGRGALTALTSLRNDFGGDAADAAQAENAGRTLGQVQNPAAHERPPVIDGDDDAATAMAHPELGAERQRAVGAGHGVLVEVLAGGGPAAGFIAVIGGDAGEAAPSGRRHDRGIGVAPRRARARPVLAAGEMMMGVAVSGIMMMPGFG